MKLREYCYNDDKGPSGNNLLNVISKEQNLSYHVSHSWRFPLLRLFAEDTFDLFHTSTRKIYFEESRCATD